MREVDAVRVTTEDGVRAMAPAPTGAFVALGLGTGDGFLEVAAIGRDGSVLDTGSYPQPTDPW
jgi:hypothetical protein